MMNESRKSKLVATCPDCGDVVLPAREVTFNLHPSKRGRADVDKSSYCFECPSCGKHRKRPVSRELIRENTSSGARILVKHTRGRPRGQKSHPENPDDNPAFTHNDLLDFRNELNDPDKLEEFLDVSEQED